MTPLLLDTDIGSDIDDALCLAYLIAQTELLGVTTVFGAYVGGAGNVSRSRAACSTCTRPN